MARSGRSRPRTKAPRTKAPAAKGPAAKGTAPKPARKDGGRRGGPAAGGRVTPKGSGRYTPPIPRAQKVSPRWVPVVMFTLLVLGMLVIVSNYLGVLSIDGAQNKYLFVGLGLIVGGFVAATRYR